MERNERVDEFSNTQLKKLLKNLTSFDLRTYPENREIYFKISKWLKVKPENVILTEGADGGLLRVFNVFISEKDKVISLNPSFAMYPLYCKMFNGKYLPFNLNLETQNKYFKEFVDFIKKYMLDSGFVLLDKKQSKMSAGTKYERTLIKYGLKNDYKTKKKYKIFEQIRALDHKK
jgi:histidinol-phosphate/aromatic aminotransferase/cobyric acid decarboxylase-like protein